MGRPGRVRARHGPHVPCAHAAVRVAPRVDEGRPRAGVGPEPHAAERRLQRHLHGGRRHPRGPRLVGPARPLVGHPRPRPLPAVDVVPDPAARRLLRRVALGVRRTAPGSTPTAAGRPPMAATRCRSSTSTTTWNGSQPTARRRSTASTARRWRASAGRSTLTLEGGRRITIDADGSFDRPYEPFQRGGLSQMRVRTDDGREGTAIYEVTGSRHHRYFPDTVVPGRLPQS